MDFSIEADTWRTWGRPATRCVAHYRRLPLGPTHVLAPHEPIVKATMTNATIAFTNYTPPVRTASH